jgi:hypothetical protein
MVGRFLRLCLKETFSESIMPLDPTIIEAVANYNFKANAERSTQNMDAHQQRLQLLAEASLAQQLNRMNSLDPEEAAAISGVVSSDLAEKIGELSGAVASAQQLMKGAQTTLPETGR